MRTKLDTAAVFETIRARTLERLTIAGAYLVDRISDNAPKGETGNLEKAYTHEVHPEENRVLVGAAGPASQERPGDLYARFVETGTKKMTPRAPIRRTLAAEGKNVLKILSGENP